MSAVTIEQRIRIAAAATPALTSLLGTLPFRWYTQGQLMQGSKFPAVVTQLISNPLTYTAGGPLKASMARVQFLIFGGQYSPGSQAAADVAAAVVEFINTLDLWRNVPITGAAQACFIVGWRDAAFVMTDTPIYQQLIDAQVLAS